MISYKLKDLIKIHNGTKYNHLSEGSIPVYGSGGIMCFVDAFLYEGEAILLPRKGTLNNIMYTNSKIWTVDTMYYASTNDFVLPYYLYCYLSLLDLSHLDSGSTLPSMTKTSYNEIVVKLPKIKIQSKVADIISTLDKKIELNNKINTELEAIAKLIYDYWFVQFDFPDANGKPYKSSGGKMVYNENLKREIPDGWEVGSLLDIATFTNGIACQKYRPNENEPYYNVIKIREMGTGFTEKSEFVSQKLPEKVVVNNGDVLFSWSATLDVKIWTGGTGGLNQHIFKITSKKYPRTYYYFEILQYLQHFKMIAELRKTTMGHITQDHLKQSRISIPPTILIESLHKIIDPILNKVILAKEENQRLAELRDWLLPMLMNGQVTVSDKPNNKTIQTLNDSEKGIDVHSADTPEALYTKLGV